MTERQLLYIKLIPSRWKSLGLNPIQAITCVLCLVFLDKISLLSHTTRPQPSRSVDIMGREKLSGKLHGIREAKYDTLANCTEEFFRLGILTIQSVSLLN